MNESFRSYGNVCLWSLDIDLLIFISSFSPVPAVFFLVFTITCTGATIDFRLISLWIFYPRFCLYTRTNERCKNASLYVSFRGLSQPVSYSETETTKLLLLMMIRVIDKWQIINYFRNEIHISSPSGSWWCGSFILSTWTEAHLSKYSTMHWLLSASLNRVGGVWPEDKLLCFSREELLHCCLSLFKRESCKDWP